MKKILSIITCLTVVLITLSGCFGNSSDKINIGVIQLVEHPSLDLAYKGFVDELNSLGYKDGENINIDFNNAQGSQVNVFNIADKLVNNRSELILAIATQSAQAVANKTKDIPIVVTAVTDLVDAKLIKSNEKSGTNVTGTTDLVAIEKQVRLIKDTLPNVKNVGILYSSSESNSLFQANKVKEELSKFGINGIDFTVSNTNDIQLVAQSMVGKVDAVYVPTDNTVVSAISTVISIFNGGKIPVYTSDVDSVEKGALASYGLDYYELGRQTARMAVSILKGESKPQDMAVQYPEEVEVVINKKAMENLDIDIPKAIQDEAKIVG